jgi:hypothetical protein
MLRFKEWLQFDEIRFDQDVATQHRLSAARNVGRDSNHIVANLLKELKGWEIELTPHMGEEDAIDKVDGHFVSGEHQGKSVQIKRRVAQRSQDDFALRITNRFRNDHPLFATPVKQLNQMSDSPINKAADIFILLNADDNKIFVADGKQLEQNLSKTFEEIEADPRHQGKLIPDKTFFRSSERTDLRLGVAGTGIAIIAYVPAGNVSVEVVRTTPQEVEEFTNSHHATHAEKEAEARRAAAEAQLEKDRQEAQRIANLKKSDLEIAIDKALESGTATMPLAGNPKAIQNKLAFVKRAANQKGLKTTFNSATKIVTFNL